MLVLDTRRVLGLSARQAVRTEVRYDPAAPMDVSMEFAVEGGPRTVWRIGRDLLRQGLRTASGLGDVRIRPSSSGDRATAWLQLTSGDMAALFELPLPPLARWLEHTYELVPAGQELAGFDWDAATADLLRGPGAHRD
ncbi:SsgA family sporulation/cell division regulator [Streptomyces sp. HPF1205]|uniref:SsgA family sporulation/cell division regulator n=1 Tax=Streptomyces sp. HPF1205 TaxID=2873262 RepID=UPI001CECFCB0|nr:SsgA family sporulation/cell division regulator [Streptomyces sp. HPF1205]